MTEEKLLVLTELEATRRNLGLRCKGLNFWEASFILLLRIGLLLLVMWTGEFTIILKNPVFFNKEKCIQSRGMVGDFKNPTVSVFSEIQRRPLCNIYKKNDHLSNKSSRPALSMYDHIYYIP